jgi:hypothetical protein
MKTFVPVKRTEPVKAKPGYVVAKEPPRLSIVISEEQKKKLDKYFGYGERRRLFSVLIDLLLTAMDKDEALVKRALVTKDIELRDILKMEG